MRKKKSKFCSKSIMLLLGTIVLLMIVGFVVPTQAQVATKDTSATTRLASTNVFTVLNPFSLRTVTYTPRVDSVSSIRAARPPRISVNNGNGNSPVLVPGRRSVRSNWIPGDGPPPHVNPPG